MQKLKEAFFSEKGMGIVNTLFWISTIFRKGWLTVMTYLVWAAYLVFCRKHAESKASRIISTVFLVFAAVLAGVNLYFLLSGTANAR